MESIPDFCNIEPTNQNIDYRKELFDKYKDFEEEDYTGIDDFLEETDKVGLIRLVMRLLRKIIQNIHQQ